MKNFLALIALLLAPAVLHSADTRYSPAWAGIAPKRVVKHTNLDGESLVKAVNALKPGISW